MTVWLLRFVKFGVVGCTGLVIDFSLTYFLKEKIKVNQYLASSCGFLVAVTNNFFLNKLWTFENHDENLQRQYVCFFMIALIGLLLSNGLIWLLNNRLKINFYLSKLTAVAVVMVWNFLANALITFYNGA